MLKYHNHHAHASHARQKHSSKRQVLQAPHPGTKKIERLHLPSITRNSKRHLTKSCILPSIFQTSFFIEAIAKKSFNPVYAVCDSLSYGVAGLGVGVQTN